MPFQPRSTDKRAEVLELYSRGHTMRAISSLLQVDDAVVSRWVDEAGIRRAKGGKTAPMPKRERGPRTPAPYARGFANWEAEA
jgi:transposase